ncbi:predicted protein [Naegleria gruberi]|uniref:Predicted protein n=1 Tax=Naegleria gruberi TaxID=5762 RepID=D2UXE2_NAEGR|nr:uncharacterized protein NAEGRDRAFT_61091 [Naegleria gruberi]EFC50616.1 predicted protein [Naegleria gruberi]|eukprot:XP_002683360.1 predicted protein [Naegleria gruberi strain NEG-M]
MAILNILILLLIFTIGCLIGSVVFAPLFGFMKGNKINPVSNILHHKEMTYEFVTRKVFENMRLWNSKLNQDHTLFSGTSPDRDEEQLVHLERSIEKIEGEDRGDRTRVPEFREKLPKGTIFFK